MLQSTLPERLDSWTIHHLQGQFSIDILSFTGRVGGDGFNPRQRPISIADFPMTRADSTSRLSSGFPCCVSMRHDGKCAGIIPYSRCRTRYIECETAVSPGRDVMTTTSVHNPDMIKQSRFPAAILTQQRSFVSDGIAAPAQSDDGTGQKQFRLHSFLHTT